MQPDGKADWKTDPTKTPPFSQLVLGWVFWLLWVFLMYQFLKTIAWSFEQLGGITKRYSTEEEFSIATEEALLE